MQRLPRTWEFKDHSEQINAENIDIVLMDTQNILAGLEFQRDIYMRQIHSIT